jgi:molybdopterin-biosynthesis enzyme MoeA-like protein
MNTDPIPRFGLIIVGDEILSGKRQDKHLPKVIELLSARGLSLAWARYVGDDRPAITAALRDAFASADVVFSCGGIGATPDDHTRQCAAAALGVPLACTPRPRPDRAAHAGRGPGAGPGLGPGPARQRAPAQHGRVPRGRRDRAQPVQQDPGLHLHRAGRRPVHFVPGFPVMAWPMIEWLLDQQYAPTFPARQWRERSVIVFGAMEAALTPLMERIEAVHPGSRCSACPAWTTRNTVATSSSASKATTQTVPAFEDLLAGLRMRQMRALDPKRCVDALFRA